MTRQKQRKYSANDKFVHRRRQVHNKNGGGKEILFFRETIEAQETYAKERQAAQENITSARTARQREGASSLVRVASKPHGWGNETV